MSEIAVGGNSFFPNINIKCLESRGHRFIPGPNFELMEALSGGMKMVDCVTSIAVSDPLTCSHQSQVRSVINGLSLCLEFSLERMYTPGLAWLPCSENIVITTNNFNIKLINDQTNVFDDEGLIWWGQFDSLKSICCRPSLRSFKRSLSFLGQVVT